MEILTRHFPMPNHFKYAHIYPFAPKETHCVLSTSLFALDIINTSSFFILTVLSFSHKHSLYPLLLVALHSLVTSNFIHHFRMCLHSDFPLKGFTHLAFFGGFFVFASTVNFLVGFAPFYACLLVFFVLVLRHFRLMIFMATPFVSLSSVAPGNLPPYLGAPP